MARTPRNPSYREQLIEAIEGGFSPQWFSRWSYHGNAKWTPQRIFWVAILMSFDEASTLTQRFENVRNLLRELFPRWKLGRSYTGFVVALQRHTTEMRGEIVGRFQRVIRECDEHWLACGWLVLAVDGSRFECPRTTRNEQQLGCAGREKTAPQIFQTTLQHVGTGLPWDFRLGPGTDSERRHLDQMLSGLPEHSLLTADAGFISFDLCLWLIRNHHKFLLRVGSNVRLLTELGFHCEVHGKIVYLWPKKRQQHDPPVVLRLIVLRDQDKQPVYLVTNILDEEVLSDETASKIYRLRWGIEVYYRTLKQTLGHQTLKSTSPEAALLEQTWVILGAWLLQSMTAKAQAESGKSPRKWSAAKALGAVRHVMRQAIGQRRCRRGQTLRDRLRRSETDTYRRKGPKQTRIWPRKKQEKPAGPPKLQPANAKQRQAAKRFWDQTQPIL